MNDFTIDKSDLKKLERFFKDFPKLLRPVTANVLNSLAFDNRKLNIRNIESSMIVRNRHFVESSLQVQKTRSAPIEQQIALSGSVKRPRFSGWEEQEKGTQSKNKRAVTLAGRGGNKRRQAISKARLKSSNKFYKPQQFAGNTLKSKFMFMMRVLNSRSGGEFILSDPLQIRRGIMPPSLYQLKSHKIKRLQSFETNKSSRIPWASRSIQQQRFNTDIAKKYEQGVKQIVARYNK